MSVSAEVAVRPVAGLDPAQALLGYAEALGDLGLATSAAELVAAVDAVQTCFERLRLLREAEELQRRADEALEVLALSQAAGSAVRDGAELLSGDADEAWNLAASGWAKALFVPGPVRERVRERASRPRVVQPPVAMDWDGLDWSRSRGGAA